MEKELERLKILMVRAGEKIEGMARDPTASNQDGLQQGSTNVGR